MAEQQRQSLCPRLIDYLAIVGARSSILPRPGGSNNGGATSNTPPPVQVRKIKFNYFSVGKFSVKC